MAEGGGRPPASISTGEVRSHLFWAASILGLSYSGLARCRAYFYSGPLLFRARPVPRLLLFWTASISGSPGAWLRR
eukprot:scaffold11805_cov111-Isochrysis_galbana.AAC.2